MDVSLANATILVAGVLSVILVLLWTIIESIYSVSDVERDIDRTKVSSAFSLCYLGLFLTSGLLAAIVEFGFDARIDDSSYAILGWMMVIWMVPGFTEVMIDELKKEASKQEPHPNEVDISKRTGVPYGWRESLFDLVYNPYPVCKNPFCNTRFAKQDSQSLGISSDFCPPCWMIKNGQPKRCDVRGCKNQFTRPEFKDPDFYSLNENEKRDNDLVTMRTIKWEICHDCEGVLDKFSDIYVPVARRGNKTRQALDRDGKVLLRPDEEDMPIW